MGDRIDDLVTLARLQAMHRLPPLFFAEEGTLLAEVEEAVPEVARALEAAANGIPINGAHR